MVEGRPSQTLCNNHSNYPVQLAQDIARRDPQHCKFVRFKIDLTQVINPRDFIVRVNFSVDLD
jgi:hypothetical protein